MREVRSWTDALIRRTPGWGGLPPRCNLFGEPIDNGVWSTKIVQPLKFGWNDPTRTELNGIVNNLKSVDTKTNTPLPLPRRNLMGVDLTDRSILPYDGDDDQFNLYSLYDMTLVKVHDPGEEYKSLREDMDTLVNSDLWKTVPFFAQYEVAHLLVTKHHDRALALAMKDFPTLPNLTAQTKLEEVELFTGKILPETLWNQVGGRQ